ncbi:substrate-binding domain-containing protein [Bariatricus massiliensis]|uniref:substrate-binding domain-containing protein n=1 Tax=Bariatricus massiliensis TaxID=1745713 RepID=UPI000836AD88|nr:substrate-binding domain-containing protein [Bariatricus massiliensis]
MKKKVLSVLLCAAMVASMAIGCGSDKKDDTAGKTDDKKTEDEAKGGDVNGDGKLVVGYISKNIVDPFHAPINDYAKETLDGLKKDGTIDDWTGVLDGETDANKQIDRADECIAKNCDYVIILPAEATASDAAVTKMTDAGIKVIVVNSKTDSTDDVAMAYVGPDDVEAGKMLAQWVIDNVPDGGKYAHCQGVIGNSAQIQRGQGIEELMKDNDKFESVGDFPCEWQADKAANVATDMMNQYGDELKAIICDNDDMSSAAQKACNDAGRTDIVCVGVDGNENPLQMVKDGEMGATVLQDGPGQVGGAIDLIKKAINGETTEKEVMIPFVLVTKDNVDEYLKK